MNPRMAETAADLHQTYKRIHPFESNVLFSNCISPTYKPKSSRTDNTFQL